jgi:hypothetical protein
MLAGERPIEAGLLAESHQFNHLMATEAAGAAMQRFLDLGGQTREGERIVDQISAQAARDIAPD